MEHSLNDMHELTNKMENMAARLEHITSRPDNITAAALAAAGKEILGREILKIENKQILNELTSIKDLIGANALTVAKQSDALGLVQIEPSRDRGRYVGNVIGLDHQAVLVKINEKNSIALSFSELEPKQLKPRMGDLVNLSFKNGVLVVSIKVCPRNFREDERLRTAVA